jgi:hypothetical protein
MRAKELEMIRMCAFVLSLVMICPNAAVAQSGRGNLPKPAPATQAATPPGAPEPPKEQPARMGQAVNVKIEFMVSDQRPALTTKRTISVMTADQTLGRVRSSSEIIGVGSIPLNVDATPIILPNGKIRLQFTLVYSWPGLPETGQKSPAAIAAIPPEGRVTSTTINDSMTVLLDDGKPVVAVQSADAIGDRQVIVEVTATLIR